MPWPWELGKWLLDETASGVAGRNIWRLPFPQESYTQDMAWNKPILDCIKAVHAADYVFSTPPEKWEKIHNQFYLAMLNSLEEDNDG